LKLAVLATLAALALSAPILALSAPTLAAPLDDVAQAYVALVLEYGQAEEGYVDAYYGPAEWAEAAKAHPRGVRQIELDAAALLRTLDAAPADGIDAARKRFLAAQLRALSTRAAMNQGARYSFADEAAALFGVRPVLKPLASYAAVLRRIDRLVPGTGPLAARVTAFRKRYEIPPAKLPAVLEASIAECKARTSAHLALPREEAFELALVTGKPWGGYNWYQGNFKSLIQVNTDLPVRIGDAVGLGCHEGYPGHHVYNVLLERNLTKGRGWVEFSVYPLYSPQSFIAEGSANYGIDLAFPGNEKLRFEQAKLYPIAGLDPKTAPALAALARATRELAGASYTIADDYLAGRLTRHAAKKLIERYQLADPRRAEQSLTFIDSYRSYIINYGLGRDMVAAHIERGAPAGRWQRMEALLSEPTLPDDLE